MVTSPFGKSRNTGPDESPQPTSEAQTPDNYKKAELRRATRTRKSFALLSSFFLIVVVAFLILVETGSTSNKPVLRELYFIRITALKVPGRLTKKKHLLNAIAKLLGLHNFYQVGLWNFCQGHANTGVTTCSKPTALYWFNPPQIVVNELIKGAPVAIPKKLVNVLHTVQIASNWMFGLFLTGTVLSFVLIFLVPLSTYSRWNSLVLTIVTFLNALFITVASAVATVMFIIMRNIFQNKVKLELSATIGIPMFACMWTAAAFAVFTCIIHMSLSCCGKSRRDVKKEMRVSTHEMSRQEKTKAIEQPA